MDRLETVKFCYLTILHIAIVRNFVLKGVETLTCMLAVTFQKCWSGVF